jgi:hypothetical protein
MADNGHRAKVPESATNITLSGQKCKLITGCVKTNGMLSGTVQLEGDQYAKDG